MHCLQTDHIVHFLLAPKPRYPPSVGKLTSNTYKLLVTTRQLEDSYSLVCLSVKETESYVCGTFTPSDPPATHIIVQHHTTATRLFNSFHSHSPLHQVSKRAPLRPPRIGVSWLYCIILEGVLVRSADYSDSPQHNFSSLPLSDVAVIHNRLLFRGETKWLFVADRK